LELVARTPHVSQTPATRLLRAKSIAFSEHPYDYRHGGGTAHSAQALGLEEYAVLKTLVMEDEAGRPLVVLMHGTHQVVTRELARAAGVKRVAPCEPATAERHSGYQVGGTSPFATRKAMPVYVQESVLSLPRIFLNGGRRGYLIGMEPADLARALSIITVDCARLD